MRKIQPEHLDTLERIGKRLRRLREEKGYLNHEEFAYDIDMARSQYGRYESGNNMNVLTLLQILDAHGLTIEEFFAL